MAHCLECNTEIIGRTDKKFCSIYCKSAYQYRSKKENESSIYNTIDKQLKQNRKILKYYNRTGKSTIRKDELISKGFNPNYFTNYWKANNGNVYLFCYEYGFLEKKEPNAIKYVLIIWQDYMKPSY